MEKFQNIKFSKNQPKMMEISKNYQPEALTMKNMTKCKFIVLMRSPTLSLLGFNITRYRI